MSYEELATAVQALASRDTDHAEIRNEVGYNKADTYFGETLARLAPSEWTPEVAREAWEMLRKYRLQLLRDHDIDFDAIPQPANPAQYGGIRGEWGDRTRRQMLEPLLPEYKERQERIRREKEEKENRRAAELTRRLLIDTGTTMGGHVFVLVLGRSRPNDLMDAVRAIPGRKWGNMRSDFGWEAPRTPEAARAIQKILKTYGYEISDEVRTDGRFITDPDTLQFLEDLAGASLEDEVEQSNPRQCRLLAGELVFTWPYEDKDFDRIVAAIKKLPTRRYEPSERSWHVPLIDPIVAWKALNIARHNDFAIDPAIDLDEIDRNYEREHQKREREEMERETRHERNMRLQREQDMPFDVPGVARPLFPFQRVGVRYILENIKPNKGVILGDDMGLGKTQQSIVAMHAANAYPVLVVTTASVKYQFEAEWNTIIPGARTLVVNGKGIEPGCACVVINYDVLGKHLDTLKSYGFKGMIVDEMHRCKSRKAQRTKNVRELAKHIPYVIGLTGTVTENRMAELEQPLQIINRLDDLGGWRHFTYDVCGAFHNGFGMQFPDPRKMSTQARDEYLEGIRQFNQKMRAEGAYIRRETDDVIDLPGMEHRLVPVEIENRAEYERARADIIAYAARLAEEDKAFLQSIKHLPEDEQKALKRQRREDAANRARRAEVLVKINALKQLTARGKMGAIKDYIESFVEVGRKVVVMCWHKEVASELAKVFNAPAIVGGVDGETKFRFQQEFNTDPNCMVIVCNIVAASEGLNLTAAADVIFPELPWNPSKLDQARRRIRRIGQTRPTAAHYLIGRDTIDEGSYALINGKRLVTSAANTGEVTEDEVTVGDLDYILKSLEGDLDESEAA